MFAGVAVNKCDSIFGENNLISGDMFVGVAEKGDDLVRQLETMICFLVLVRIIYLSYGTEV